MADKMLRIAGRSNNGRARALKVNDNGNMEIRNGTARQLFNETNMNAGASVETGILDSEGYTFAKANIMVTNKRKIRVSIQYYRNETGLAPQGYETIYESEILTSSHLIEYHLHGKYYSLKVENIDSGGGLLTKENYEVRTDNGLPESQRVKILQNKRFREITLNFNTVQSGSFLNVNIKAPLGKIWHVKFIVADIRAGSSGVVALTWRLGNEDGNNDFFRAEGNRIDIRPHGITSGEVMLPSQYSPNNLSQFWDHMQNVAFVGNDFSSRFIITNSTNVETSRTMVKLYVVEEG